MEEDNESARQKDSDQSVEAGSESIRQTESNQQTADVEVSLLQVVDSDALTEIEAQIRNFHSGTAATWTISRFHCLTNFLTKCTRRLSVQHEWLLSNVDPRLCPILRAYFKKGLRT